MKKCQKKLHLHRDTVQKLDDIALPRIQGGDEWTGCLSDCTACGGKIGRYAL